MDFSGHCNQIDVSLKLVFSWRALSVSMIGVNPNGPSLGRGGSNFREDPGGYRTWGFYNFKVSSGMGLLDFPSFGFVSHYDQG